MKSEEIAKRIVDASKNNSLTFFVGAGVSKCSGIPLWGELIEKICIEMKMDVPKNLSSDDYLRIPQMFYYTCGNSKEYVAFIKRIIDKPDAVPNEIHRLMLKFRPVSFLTTNYDYLLENAAVEYGQSYKSVVEDEEVASINGDRFILKVHGDIEHGNFVLREEDYLAYEERFKLISPFVSSIFSTNTVVFIGYGIRDYNVKLILDGVRRVLKDKFEPIFIRVEEEALSREEQKYYESRGLNVIEYSKVTTPEERSLLRSDDYLARYVAVLNYISSVTKEKLIGETEEESFLNLYNRLLPLDKLSALRITDIQSRVSECCGISNTGVIYVHKGKEVIFKKFISIHELSVNERKDITESDQKKYRLVRRVLNKGQVYQIAVNNRRINIYDKRTTFADDKCVSFDYSGMTLYCKNDYKKTPAKLRKAFYMTRLRRYEEAFDAFIEIAQETFKNRDYVNFYLAEINCIALRKVMQNPAVRFNKEKLIHKKEEKLLSWETENDLFDSLPQEFKSEYFSLRQLCTKELLYQYGYEALMAAMKLEKSLVAHSIEIGETSGGRVISRVNEYLHFLLGNGVCLDEFIEYKASVCTLMEMLIRKYADQQHKTLRNQGLFDVEENKISFDQYDFYCLVKLFKNSELEKVLKNNNCKTIVFENMDKIESAITNLIIYTEKVIREADTLAEKEGFIGEISTCLVLARHIRLSERIVEEICRFIFKYNLISITIDQKILFLDYQVFSRHITNANIQRILENALIKYIDERLNAVSNGKKWDSLSKISGVNYPNIADYIDINKEGIVLLNLSKRVSNIIDRQIVPMQQECVEHYYNLISRIQRKRLTKWIENMLIDNFEFERFTLLIQIDANRAKKYSDKLYSFLKGLKEESKNEEKEGVVFYPREISDEKLIRVGFWCMCGLLDPKEFISFKGINLEYDFFIDAKGFDYSKFNVGWLLEMNRYALTALTKDEHVRIKLLKIILQEINKDELKQDEKDSLVRILGEYFAN